MDKPHLAHRREDTGEEQLLIDHLRGTAELAGEFGKYIHAEEQAYRCGLMHDGGKYSMEFAAHLHGAQMRVDHSTAGALEAGKRRVLDINPDCVVRTYPQFYTPDTAGTFDFSQYDYVVDAIDTVTGKLALVQQAHDVGVPIISCMGTGNKLDASQFEVADISKTSMCPLARVMRRELGKRGIRHLKVVYSKEEALTPTGWEEEAAALGKRQIPGSVAFVPGAAGLILAGEVVRDIALGDGK